MPSCSKQQRCVFRRPSGAGTEALADKPKGRPQPANLSPGQEAKRKKHEARSTKHEARSTKQEARSTKHGGQSTLEQSVGKKGPRLTSAALFGLLPQPLAAFLSLSLSLSLSQVRVPTKSVISISISVMGAEVAFQLAAWMQARSLAHPLTPLGYDYLTLEIRVLPRAYRSIACRVLDNPLHFILRTKSTVDDIKAFAITSRIRDRYPGTCM